MKIFKHVPALLKTTSLPGCHLQHSQSPLRWTICFPTVLITIWYTTPLTYGLCIVLLCARTQAHWEWRNLCFIHCCVPRAKKHNGLNHSWSAFLFLTKVDDGIYSKRFLTCHQKLLNAAKYFANLSGDTDTSIHEFNSYVTEEKAVIMES